MNATHWKDWLALQGLHEQHAGIYSFPNENQYVDQFICPLLSYELIRVEGHDPRTFLQGQLTCDLAELSEQNALLGAFCNLQGRIITLLYVLLFQQQYFLMLPRELKNPVITELAKPALFSKIKLIDLEKHWQIIGINSDVYASLLVNDLPKSSFQQTTEAEKIIIRLSQIQQRYLLFTTQNPEKLFSHKINLVGINIWNLTEIADYVPCVDTKTMAIFTPEEIDLAKLNGVSYHKGCYRGQEIIARMHFLGKHPFSVHLAKFHYSDTLPSGTAIQNQNKQTVGKLIRMAKAFDNSNHCLISIKNFSAQEKYFIAENIALEIINL